MNNLTIQDIVNALNKQQPKKVITKTTYYDELIAYDTYKTVETKSFSCPSCKVLIHHKPQYCEKCGQRLDFGESESK